MYMSRPKLISYCMIFRIAILGKHRILDSNPMSLQILQENAFDFLATLIVHDAMNLSQHPITIFTKSFNVVLYPRCSCILIVNYTLSTHGLLLG